MDKWIALGIFVVLAFLGFLIAAGLTWGVYYLIGENHRLAVECKPSDLVAADQDRLAVLEQKARDTESTIRAIVNELNRLRALNTAPTPAAPPAASSEPKQSLSPDDPEQRKDQTN